MLIFILSPYACFLIGNKIITKKIKLFQQLSEKIIQGKLIEPIDILKEYNEIELHNKFIKSKERDMYKKYNYALYSKSFLYAGMGFLVIGFIFAIYYALTNDIIAATFWFGFFSGGVGLFSIGVAFHSTKIAQESDEKMKAIANVNFQEISDKFSNRRLELYKNRLSPYEMELTAWKCRTYIDSAKKLKKWVDIEIQEIFVTKYNNLIKTYPWKDTSFSSTKGKKKLKRI